LYLDYDNLIPNKATAGNTKNTAGLNKFVSVTFNNVASLDSLVEDRLNGPYTV
jgi:hypothetical protein